MGVDNVILLNKVNVVVVRIELFSGRLHMYVHPGSQRCTRAVKHNARHVGLTFVFP